MNCSKCNHPLTLTNEVSEYNQSERVVRCDKCGISFSVRMDENPRLRTRDSRVEKACIELAKFIIDMYKWHTPEYPIWEISHAIAKVMHDQLKNTRQCIVSENGDFYENESACVHEFK